MAKINTDIRSDNDFTMNLTDKAIIQYFPNFLSQEEHNKLYEHLEIDEKIKWEQGIYNMYGKNVATPRLLWAMHDSDGKVHDNYKVTKASEWTNEIKVLKEKIENKLNAKITYAQLNCYRDGKDYIGYHSDKEVEKGDSIYSISLGSQRKFILMDKKTENKYEMELKPGSLLVMNYEASNSEFKHTVPKQVKQSGKRYNITFRNK